MSYLDLLLSERCLPDAFGGITSEREFVRHREKLKRLLCDRQYGKIPPVPKHIYLEQLISRPFYTDMAQYRETLLHIELERSGFSFLTTAIIPKRDCTVPAIILLNTADDGFSESIPYEEIADLGVAVFSFKCEDITRNNNDFKSGAAKHLSPSRRASNSPGKLCMWAWAAMRVMDYAAACPEIDKDAIAVLGHGIYAKSALIASAFDERFSYAAASSSGCAGTALERGKQCENFDMLVSNMPYLFCPSFVNSVQHKQQLELDQHFLISLSAPRTVILSCAKGDHVNDPISEFLALYAASPAYKFFGKNGLVTPDRLPDAHDSLTDGGLCYIMKDGYPSLSRHDIKKIIDIIKTKSAKHDNNN